MSEGHRFAVSVFIGGTRDRWPDQMFLDWGVLSRGLTRFTPLPLKARRLLAEAEGQDEKAAEKTVKAAKEHCPAWSPTEYPPRTPRAAENVVSVSCLALDYDDGIEPAEVSWEWRAYRHLWHTSWSHTTGHAKFRVVLPLAVPVPALRWRLAWEWARIQWPIAAVGDPKCCNPDRLYFKPVDRGPEYPKAAKAHDAGELLRLDYQDYARQREHEEAERRARVTRIGQGTVGSGEARRAMFEALKVDPAARERLAVKLGARLSGIAPDRRASHIPCPACSEPSVWFPLEPRPGGLTGAECNHKKSCGWHGSLLALGEIHLGRAA